MRWPCEGRGDLFVGLHTVGLRRLPKELPPVVDEARALCAQCPDRDACFVGALLRQEPSGMWGGVLFPHEARTTPIPDLPPGTEYPMSRHLQRLLPDDLESLTRCA